jgi:16S rRNA A1518/A1519 N6-dimethyltransferase RsmA/KsgA/DIM1 with predicted DNA glycosylase/AP lyase activity
MRYICFNWGALTTRSVSHMRRAMEIEMDELSKSIAVLETKYGKIDNIKFLLGDAKDMSEDDVLLELKKAVKGFEDGTVVPCDNFDDSALAAL